MLVMRRREGEAVLIGEDVEIRVLAVQGNRVKLGITAPRSIRVQPLEVELVKAENRAAASLETSALSELAAWLRPDVAAIDSSEISPKVSVKRGEED